MFRLIHLFLPVLFPSWRFFAVIEPSPRIEFCVRRAGVGGELGDLVLPWRELYPRPARVGVGQALTRLVFNPHVNERLFLVTCAERLVEHGDARPAACARAHIAAHVSNVVGEAVATRGGVGVCDGPDSLTAQFRIVLVDRAGDGDGDGGGDADGLIRQEVYRSPDWPLASFPAPPTRNLPWDGFWERV